MIESLNFVCIFFFFFWIACEGGFFFVAAAATTTAWLLVYACEGDASRADYLRWGFFFIGLVLRKIGVLLEGYRIRYRARYEEMYSRFLRRV